MVKLDMSKKNEKRVEKYFGFKRILCCCFFAKKNLEQN